MHVQTGYHRFNKKEREYYETKKGMNQKREGANDVVTCKEFIVTYIFIADPKIYNKIFLRVS